MADTAYSRDFSSADPAAETAPMPRPAAAPPTAPRPALNAVRLWTGGAATAVVAALVAAVGVLVLRVLALHVVGFSVGGVLATDTGTLLLCVGAAVAALAATGVAHLLLVTAPRPVAFLGWIVGLATAAAAVLPLASGLPVAAAAVEGLVNLVIGLTIGSLVTGAAYAAR